MQCDRAGEEPYRDEPSQALAPSDTAGDRQQPDAGERDQSSRGLAHPEGDVAEQGVEPPPDLRWHDGRDEVAESQDRDPCSGKPPYPPETAGGIGDLWPHATAGEGGDHRRFAIGVLQVPGREPLQDRDRAQVPAGEEEPCVHLCSPLDLDPGDLAEMDEDRRQAEARRPLLHDFAARAGVRVKAGADPRELRLERVARHKTEASCGQDRAGCFTSPVIGVVGRRSEQRSPGRVPYPVIDHSENDPGHDHLGDKGEAETEQPGREGLEPFRHTEQPPVGEPREKCDCDGDQQPPQPPDDAAVGEARGHETRQTRRIGQPVDAGEPRRGRSGKRRQDLSHRVLAERRVALVGRVDEGVALVETPPGLDADLFWPGGSRDLQLGRERDLETGVDDGGIRLRVVKDRPVPVAGQEDGAAVAVRRQVGLQRPAQLLVCSECGCGVGIGRYQQVEGVAGDDDGAGALGPFESWASSTDVDPDASVRLALRKRSLTTITRQPTGTARRATVTYSGMCSPLWQSGGPPVGRVGDRCRCGRRRLFMRDRCVPASG